MLYYMINKNAQIVFNGVSDTGNMSHDTTKPTIWVCAQRPVNLPIVCYLQSTVTSKFTEYLLFTVDCHQQIYRIFAIDSRLSPATPFYFSAVLIVSVPFPFGV